MSSKLEFKSEIPVWWQIRTVTPSAGGQFLFFFCPCCHVSGILETEGVTLCDCIDPSQMVKPKTKTKIAKKAEDQDKSMGQIVDEMAEKYVGEGNMNTGKVHIYGQHEGFKDE